jgi:hypothetical protein
LRKQGITVENCAVGFRMYNILEKLEILEIKI